MALSGFPVPPKQIKVKLGAFWIGGGAGLTSGMELILYKEDGSDSWYEKEGSTTPDTSENRLRIRPTNHGTTSAMLITPLNYLDQWESSAMSMLVFSGTNSPTYTFLNVWSYTTGQAGTLDLQFFVTNVVSLSNTAGTGAGDPTLYNPKTFSLLEEYEPVEPGLGPDKTSYHYG